MGALSMTPKWISLNMAANIRDEARAAAFAARRLPSRG